MDEVSDRMSNMDRRKLLWAISTTTMVGGANTAAAKSPAPAADAGQVHSTFIEFDDPIEAFEAKFRFERDLVPVQGACLTWYNWMAYIVPEGSAPQPIVRYEGMEYSYFRKVADHTYRIHAHNLSYPRDLSTSLYCDTVTNPLTGELVKVPNTVLLNDPGTVQSPRGFRNVNGDGTYVVPYWQFRRENGSIKLDSVRSHPPNWPTTFMESSTQWVPYELFLDKTITSLPYETCAVYVFPYPAWLKMGDRKGHMLGFIDGRKIGGPDKLPEEFLTRTRREYPELLSPRWGEFARPASFVY